MRQFIIKKKGASSASLELSKEYKQIIKGRILTLHCTLDGKFVFTGDSLGNIRQFSLKMNGKIKEYNKITKKPITSLNCSHDSKYLYIGTSDGKLKLLSINNQMLMKDFGQILNGRISSILISCDLKWMFISNDESQILQFDQERFTDELCHGIDSQQNILLPLGINFFSYNRDMNLLSSVILNMICSNNYIDLKEFLVGHKKSIMNRYASTKYFSTLDILVMMYA